VVHAWLRVSLSVGGSADHCNCRVVSNLFSMDITVTFLLKVIGVIVGEFFLIFLTEKLFVCTHPANTQGVYIIVQVSVLVVI
jgi:hypothetical protein